MLKQTCRQTVRQTWEFSFLTSRSHSRSQLRFFGFYLNKLCPRDHTQHLYQEPRWLSSVSMLLFTWVTSGDYHVINPWERFLWRHYVSVPLFFRVRPDKGESNGSVWYGIRVRHHFHHLAPSLVHHCTYCSHPRHFSSIKKKKWNESGFRLHLCTCRLNWARDLEKILWMVRWVRWHCPPDTWFEIQTLEVWGQARYLSVTEAPHNTGFYEWMGQNILAPPSKFSQWQVASKHHTSTQCWFIVVTASQKLAQQ